mmetsp:Transcript_3016/g.7173  ORF Transcript_3016/g.7173 Transcript_3016/m.7173 type:complete len:250 (+) Transcript_3016:348-1097(+)
MGSRNCSCGRDTRHNLHLLDHSVQLRKSISLRLALHGFESVAHENCVDTTHDHSLHEIEHNIRNRPDESRRQERHNSTNDLPLIRISLTAVAFDPTANQAAQYNSEEGIGHEDVHQQAKEQYYHTVSPLQDLDLHDVINPQPRNNSNSNREHLQRQFQSKLGEEIADQPVTQDTEKHSMPLLGAIKESTAPVDAADKRESRQRLETFPDHAPHQIANPTRRAVRPDRCRHAADAHDHVHNHGCHTVRRQ